MYVWIWRHLPGPIVVKLLQVAALVIGVVVVLFHWVFPVIEPWVNEPSLPWH